MTQFEVWESCARDMEGGTMLKAFDTHDEAVTYVRENDNFLEGGCALFIIPTSDK